MADDSAPSTPEGAPPKRHWRTRTKLILFGMLLSPVLLFALYTMMTLSWTYSDGYRAGILQKFSRRGWICKTYEGEIAQAVVAGVSPLIWNFTVRNDQVAQQLDSLLGRRVSLHYREHRGVPTSCFGHTGYFVDSVSVVHE
jgi:hypothetical protein